MSFGPQKFNDTFSYISGGSRDAEKCNLYTPTSRSHKSFEFLGAKCWNSMPQSLRTSGNVDTLVSQLKQYFMNEVCNNSQYRINNKFDFFYETEVNIE